jgi:hypothetical protein
VQRRVLEGVNGVQATSRYSKQAFTLLGTAENDLYARIWFRSSVGANNVNLLRFRSGTTGTGEAILGVFIGAPELGYTASVAAAARLPSAARSGIAAGAYQPHDRRSVCSTARRSVSSKTENLGNSGQRLSSASGQPFDVAFDGLPMTPNHPSSSAPYTRSTPYHLVTTSNAANLLSATAAGATFNAAWMVRPSAHARRPSHAALAGSALPSRCRR